MAVCRFPVVSGWLSWAFSAQLLRNVLGMVLKQGMTMALIGTAIGIVLAFLLFRGLHSVLYGVASTDLVTLAAVSSLLLAIAFVASYIPALRATQVDPVVALREQ